MSNEVPMSKMLDREMETMWNHLKVTADGIDVIEGKIGGRWEFKRIKQLLDPIQNRLSSIQKQEIDIRTSLGEILEIEAEIVEEMKKLDDSRLIFLFNKLRRKLVEMFQFIAGIIMHVKNHFHELLELKAVASNYKNHADTHIQLANHLLEREQEIMDHCDDQITEAKRLIGILEKKPATEAKVEGMIEDKFASMTGNLNELIANIESVRKDIDDEKMLVDLDDEFEKIVLHARLAVARVEKIDAAIEYLQKEHQTKGYADKKLVKNVVKGIKLAKRQIKGSLKELKEAGEELQDKMMQLREPIDRVITLRQNLEKDFRVIVQEHARFAHDMWAQVQAEFIQLGKDMSDEKRIKYNEIRQKLSQEELKFNHIVRSEVPTELQPSLDQ